jgi:hypothetical protein
MYYHRRFLEDGSCEIVCTHCFRTIGAVSGRAAIKKLEAEHLCSAPARSNPQLIQVAVSPAPSARAGWLPDYPEKLAGMPLPLLLFAVPLILYLLPTLIEIALSASVGPWLPAIVVGDFTACACVFAVFRMRKTGVTLYLLMIGLKLCLYVTQIVSASVLLWLTDLIPALIVMGKIASLRSRLPARAFPHP